MANSNAEHYNHVTGTWKEEAESFIRECETLGRFFMEGVFGYVMMKAVTRLSGMMVPNGDRNAGPLFPRMLHR